VGKKRETSSQKEKGSLHPIGGKQKKQERREDILGRFRSHN